MTPDQAKWFADVFGRLVTNIGHAVLGKQHVVRLALTCLVSEGHLLLEDFPVTGVTIYDQSKGTFDFHPGPIFSTIVLADEINRASPKTQSALLEVMEEGRVTVDGVSHNVGRPFMVIATQNPIEQAGTYRLPEAQLDRFLMKSSLGYPDHEATVALLSESAVRDRTSAVQAIVTAEQISEMAKLAAGVHVDQAVLAYVSRLAEESRRHQHVKLGLSVRGCLAMVRSAKTWAASLGRNFVIPDDIKELAVPVLSHRILL